MIIDEYVYLDSASTTQKPKEVIKRITKFYEDENANIHRGIYPLSINASKLYDNARETVAKFINAEKKKIIFTRNTTESINLVASQIDRLSNKKKIVLTILNHHSNIVPWQKIAKEKGMEIEFIGIDEEFNLDLKDAKKKIKDAAIVSFSHISNVTGTVLPIKELIDLARMENSLIFVDAAQSAPHKLADASDVDFLAFSAHKVYGPTGIGVLYAKDLEKLTPTFYGGDMVEEVDEETYTLTEIPTKFEGGTQHIAGAIGMAEGIKYLEKQKIDENLRDYVYEKLSRINGVRLVCPKEGIGIISFIVDKIHSHDIVALLGEQKVCVRGGNHCCMPLMKKIGLNGTIRISLGVHNTKEDIENFLNALKNTIEVLR